MLANSVSGKGFVEFTSDMASATFACQDGQHFSTDAVYESTRLGISEQRDDLEPRRHLQIGTSVSAAHKICLATWTWREW